MLSRFIALLGVAAVGVVAQTANFSSSDIQAVIGNETLTIRNSWCNAQYDSCTKLCSGDPSDNTCSGANLTWSCICASNKSSPALQYYVPTIVTNICNEAQGLCLASNAGDAEAQDKCKTDYVCGNSSVEDFKPETSSAAASTTTGMGTATGLSSPLPTLMTTTSHAVAATLAPVAAVVGAEIVGFGVLGAGLLAVLQMAI